MFFNVRAISLILLLFYFHVLLAQETFSPTRINENEIILDGLLSEKIWKNATKIPLDIEISPANNLEVQKKTTAYVTYSDTYLFIAFYAEDDPKNIRGSIRPRDDFNIWNDDLVMIRLDPFADARNNQALEIGRVHV